ncbi:hypothetical protein [Streptomyces hokutonensis]
MGPRSTPRQWGVLGEYCTALDRRLDVLGGAMDELAVSARRWSEWA